MTKNYQSHNRSTGKVAYHNWMMAVAFIIILASWIIQYFVAANYTDMRKQYELTESMILIKQLDANYWLTEKTKLQQNPNPSKSLDMYISYKYLCSNAYLTAAMQAKSVQADSRKAESISLKRKALKQYKEWYDKGVYDSLNAAFIKSADFSEKVMEPMLDKGILNYNKVSKEEKKYTILFIALNLIGTLLFALYHILPKKE